MNIMMCAVVFLYGSDNAGGVPLWILVARGGIIASSSGGPSSILGRRVKDRATPILDRFLSWNKKESYLPTLQAHSGKAEFTYSPSNTQEVLLVPIQLMGGGYDGEEKAVLVLGVPRPRAFRRGMWRGVSF